MIIICSKNSIGIYEEICETDAVFTRRYKRRFIVSRAAYTVKYNSFNWLCKKYAKVALRAGKSQTISFREEQHENCYIVSCVSVAPHRTRKRARAE